MHDQLTEVLQRRPAVIVIASEEGRIAEAYEAVIAALADTPTSSCHCQVRSRPDLTVTTPWESS